jgi:hypothetical protein
MVVLERHRAMLSTTVKPRTMSLRSLTGKLAVCVALAGALASCKSGSADCNYGDLDCPCYSDKVCNAGLVCAADGYCSPSGGAAGTTGAAGASAGTGGAGGRGGAGPPARCTGRDLSADGVLDLDLKAIRVSGTVTLAGAPLPTETASRGRVVFTDRDGVSASYDLGTTGAGTYALTLPPGTFSVRFEGNAALCEAATLPAMPCGSGVLIPSVDLTASGAVDLDVPVARLTGTVTLNGAAFANHDADRGRLQFTSASGASVKTKAFGATGAVQYGVTLLPGKYDVSFIGNPALCQGTQAAAAPCNSGILRKDVTIATGALDFDVRSVAVTGQVTLAGAALPAEAMSRGTVSFTAAGGGSVSARDLGATGAATYAVSLLPGRYDVAFAGNLALCAAAVASMVPCNGGVVHAGVALDASGAVDVDLHAVTVGGSVTLDGAALPDEAAGRGAVALSLGGGAPVLSRPLAATGAATYQVTVIPGTYRVSYAANAALCATTTATPKVPCTGGTIVPSIGLTSSGVVDVDLKSVRVSGTVTVNGAPMPTEAAARGQVVFSREGGTVSTVAFPPSGAATYGVTLLPGTYDVGFAANPALCGAGKAPPKVPCMSGTLMKGLTLKASGAIDLDLPARTISGAVTLLGAVLPDEASGRGQISFARVEPNASSGSASVDLGATGPGLYGLTILPGRYVVSHAANAGLCGPGLPASKVACASQLVLGCE